MLHPFTYEKPDSVGAVLERLADYAAAGRAARVLNGGTDLLVNIRMGTVRVDHVIDIKGASELYGRSWDPETGLRIGATVTVNDLLGCESLAATFPVFKEAAQLLADHSLRNRATVVGNLVTASPCGDTTPPLLALDARVVIASVRGEREMALGQFITGVKRTVIEPDEIVARIIIPPTYAGARGGYRKMKRIKGHDLGLVMVAMVRTDDEVRFAVGSAAPTTVLVAGLAPDVTVADAQAAVDAVISPIDDVRASADYRRAIVATYVKQLLQEVA